MLFRSEIHPETPPEGRPVTDLFSQHDIDHVLSVCRQRVKPYGLTFGERPWLSNSRLSLEAAEYARDMGCYDALHHGLFEAYFSDGEDIGSMDVLLRVAGENGLQPSKLEPLLETGKYSVRVSQGSAEAKKRGVTAVPTFFVEDLPAITGAVHEDKLRAVLQSIAKK